MGKSILQGATAYSKEFITRPYIDSKFAILSNNEKVDYSPKGESIKVRTLHAGNPGLYSAERGWGYIDGSGYGGEDSVTWEEYMPTHEMAKTIEVDLKDELDSYTEGAPSSFVALIRDFIKGGVAPVFDQATVCDIYAETVENNRFSTTEYPIDKDNIFSTLLKIQALHKEVSEEPIFTFVSNTVMANIKAALLDSPSGVVALYKQGQVELKVNNLDEGSEDEGTLSLNIAQFDDMFLISVPSGRMNSHAIFYDGFSEGQETGGFVPATEEEGYCKIHILSFPEGSCFTSLKWIVSNLWVPTTVAGLTVNQAELDDIKNNIMGQIQFEAVTPNILKSAFRMDLRALYGAGILKGREETVYAVTAA